MQSKVCVTVWKGGRGMTMHTMASRPCIVFLFYRNCSYCSIFVLPSQSKDLWSHCFGIRNKTAAKQCSDNVVIYLFDCFVTSSAKPIMTITAFRNLKSS